MGAGAAATIIEAADSTAGNTVTFTGPSSLIQDVTVRNNGTTPNNVGIFWGSQGSGSQLLESKIAGFPTGVYVSGGLEGATIENNWITGNANGILMEAILKDSSIRFNDLSANNLTDGSFTNPVRPNASIRALHTYSGENNTIEYNALMGSSRGVDNNSTGEIKAEKNWWGSKYGPAQGSLTQGQVDADAWLCSGVDTQPSLIGFQPAITETCTAGAGTRLVFAAQPTNHLVNRVFDASPALRVEDAAGNLAVTFAGDVTLALGPGSPHAGLKGTRTVAAVDGIASFTGLYVDGWGTEFTLTASASGLTSVTSSSFDILPRMTYLPILSK